MSFNHIRNLALIAGASLSLSGTALYAANVTTQHNDSARTGANAAETHLTAANVRVATFGKLFTRAVEGQIYAQPLYLANIPIPGKGVHNVVYVVTEHNVVYAFDADDPAQSDPLWSVNLGPAVQWFDIGDGYSQDLLPEIGITSTPVIDPVSGTIYVVSVTAPTAGDAVFRLHALDVTTGAEKFRGPVVIQGSVKGTAPGSVNGTLTFDPKVHAQRPGLLLQNGNIYIGFASHADLGSYHGWIFAYDQKSLRQVAVRCLTPDGVEGGIWQSGVGLAGDGAGSIYALTGNGSLGGNNYGQSVVKLSSLGGLALTDYFAPNDWGLANPHDEDLGSGGPLLIPGTSLLIAGGKTGTVYVLDTKSLGSFEPTDQVVQEWHLGADTFGNSLFGGNVYYNSTLYIWSRADVLRTWTFNGAAANPAFTPGATGPITTPYGYKNDPGMSLSANGTTPGTAVLWAAYSKDGIDDGYPYPGILRAFDATTLDLIWNSDQAPLGRDTLGSWSKWCPPTIADGKVFIGTFDGVLNVYGLLP